MGKKGENIYKRKDGRWEARYIKEYTPEGIARYGYCYGRTYFEAKDKVNHAKSTLLNHVRQPEAESKRHFASYCDEWLRLKRSSVKESTFAKYESTLLNHIRPGLGKYYVEALSEILVEQFSYELLHKAKLSVKTVRDILSMLHSILNYAERRYPSIGSIGVVYPKVPRKEMRVLSCDEQHCFTEYLLKDMDECKFGILLALFTGLRIGELCALKWEDISLPNQMLSVRQTMQRLKNMNNPQERKTKIIISVPKSNTSARRIPINAYMAEFCRKWEAENPAAYILTGGNRYMEPRTLQYRMEQYTRDCKLAGVHFHTLRHSFATRCVEVGFEIKSLSEILGHSSPRITLERYVHSSMELKRENMDKLITVCGDAN